MARHETSWSQGDHIKTFCPSVDTRWMLFTSWLLDVSKQATVNFRQWTRKRGKKSSLAVIAILIYQDTSSWCWDVDNYFQVVDCVVRYKLYNEFLVFLFIQIQPDHFFSMFDWKHWHHRHWRQRIKPKTETVGRMRLLLSWDSGMLVKARFPLRDSFSLVKRIHCQDREWRHSECLQKENWRDEERAFCDSSSPISQTETSQNKKTLWRGVQITNSSKPTTDNTKDENR